VIMEVISLRNPSQGVSREVLVLVLVLRLLVTKQRF